MNFDSNKDIFSEENSQSTIFEEKRASVELKGSEFQGEKSKTQVIKLDIVQSRVKERIS